MWRSATSVRVRQMSADTGAPRATEARVVPDWWGTTMMSTATSLDATRWPGSGPA